MLSYFFIPGTRLHKIPDIQVLGVDEIIIDLEDAVAASERAAILSNLDNSPLYKSFWLRLFLRDSFEQAVDTNLLKKLLRSGYSKFIFPKLKNKKEFEDILKVTEAYNNIEHILLIEHPYLISNLEEFLKTFQGNINGVGIGTHDLLSFIGGKHTFSYLEYPRCRLLYAAKSYNIAAIDFASMEIADTDMLKLEISDGFERGFDGKFLIHPNQLNVFNNIDFYTKQETELAYKIVSAVKEAEQVREFKPIVVDGKIIERPHIKRAEQIIKYINKHG